MTFQVNHLQPLSGNNLFTDRDIHWMQHAYQLAERAASLGEVPVGAVLVRNDEILGEGYNQPISAQDPSAHAEIIALRQAAKKIQNYRLLDTTIYVTLEPCTMCAGAMVHARIGRLIYGANEPRAGAVTSVAQCLDQPFLNHQVKHQGGLLAIPCGNLLSEFFKARR